MSFFTARPLVPVVLLSLLTACGSPSAEPVAEQDAPVDLASQMEQPLSASFMSEHQTFSYTMIYDGAELTLMDQAPGAAVTGPYFEVLGGGTITGETTWVTEVTGVDEQAGAPVQVGDYSVYRYEEMKDACTREVALVPYAQEALRLVLTSCADDDLTSGETALDTLLQGLALQSQ